MPTVSRRPQGAPPSAPRRHLIAPHHQFYVGSLLAVVATFTLLSLVFQTHAYNVSLSKIPSAPLEPHLKPVASFFARKSNIINRWFIKKAWLWTTLAHLAQLLTLRAPPTPEAKLAASRARGKKKVDSDDEASSAEEGAPEDQAATVTSPFAKSLLRWFIATLCWLSFAVWLFGPPLMSRILTSSGGICVPRESAISGFSNPSGSASAPAPFRMPDKRIDDAFCHAGPRGISKAEQPELFRATHAVISDMTASGSLRGSWKGGHDVSGHVFILILSTLLLLEEVTPYLAQYFNAVLPPSLSASLVPLIPRSLRATKDPYRGERGGASFAATTFILGLVALWTFSLVNTSLFFHTPAEKFSGALMAIVSWVLLPKGG